MPRIMPIESSRERSSRHTLPIRSRAGARALLAHQRLQAGGEITMRSSGAACR